MIKIVFFVCGMAIPVFLFGIEEYGDSGAEHRILIAMESTPFKKALVEAMVERLEDEELYIRIVNHLLPNVLDEEDPAEYSAIFITNSGVGSQIRPHVVQWLSQYPDAHEHILLHTTRRDFGWTPKAPAKVDSITSPSRTSEIEMIVDALVTFLEEQQILES